MNEELERLERNGLAALEAIRGLTVWRGQRRGGEIESMLPTVCFGSRETACVYAESPNDRTIVEEDVSPVVFAARLAPSKVFAPFGPGDGDPFIDLETINALLGRDAARRICAEAGEAMRNTNAWGDISAETGFDDLLEAFDAWPEKIPFMPPVLAHEAMRLGWFVDGLRDAGYDAALVGGCGQNALEDEYHALDPRIIKIGFSAEPPEPREEDELSLGM